MKRLSLRFHVVTAHLHSVAIYAWLAAFVGDVVAGIRFIRSCLADDSPGPR